MARQTKDERIAELERKLHETRRIAESVIETIDQDSRQWKMLAECSLANAPEFYGPQIIFSANAKHYPEYVARMRERLSNVQ
jgi:hypothetical protein